ncbi:amino acid ABC transporter ATP-binding/permease protein [Enterococcus faecalis]|uniref:amino acid ABC transporter ATP-binding/permease protein n=1 Tax=Enterococcus faecalis TaxID=1351 RepID=UPI002DB84E08|nr:ABC transporter ATP-binding protein [Enterococcus faecalis]MEB7481140.1 ABC transporter ATP-binding protein/permease [Enterococcus faecalis]
MICELLKYCKHLNQYLFGSLLFALISSFFQIAIVARLLYDLMAFNFSLKLFLLLIFSSVIVGVSNYLEQYLGHYVAFKVLSDLRGEVYQKLRELGPAKLDTKEHSKIIALIHTDIELVEVFFAHTIVPFFKAIIILIVFTGIYIFFLGIVGLFVLIPYSLIGFVFPFFKKKLSNRLNKELMLQKQATQRYTFESIRGNLEILQFQILSKRKLKIKDLTNEEIVTNKKIKLIDKEKKHFILGAIIITWVMLFLLVDIFGSWDVIKQVLVLIFPFTFRSQVALSNLSISFGKALSSIKNLLLFLNEKKTATTGFLDRKDINTVKVDNVNFYYPNNSEIILSNINLRFDLNKIIGITGDSGSGKSTLVKLLMRWYDYQSGNFKLDGVELKNISQQSIRKHINYVPQIPHFFNCSLRENLIFYDEIPDEEIWQILEAVNLKDKISRMPLNLDTLVEIDSVPFSSGELQRLELCRALLHPAKLLVLDEPTSNLDNENAQQFLDVLKKNRNEGVILISHKEKALEISDENILVSNKNCKIVKNKRY